MRQALGLVSSPQGQGMAGVGMPQRLTPERRRQHALLAIHTRWANEPDPVAATALARTAFLERFEREVDPDGQLDPKERARRAEHARKAYFAKLALASSRARAAKKAGDGP